MSKTLTTVADLAKLGDDDEITFTLTETVSTTRAVTMTAAEAREHLAADTWTDSDKLTGDLPYTVLRDELSDAFGGGKLVHDEEIELTVDKITID